MGNITADLLFSYWLLVWFSIYYIALYLPGSLVVLFIRKYFNPLLGLYFAFIENLVTLFYLIFIASSTISIKYFIVLLLIKALPIYLLWDNNYKINPQNDFLVFCIIFFTYNIYLWINNTNAIEIYLRTINAIKKGENITPLFTLMHNIYK